MSEKRFRRALMGCAAWSANTAVSLIGWDTEVKLRRQCLAFNPEVVRLLYKIIDEMESSGKLCVLSIHK